MTRFRVAPDIVLSCLGSEDRGSKKRGGFFGLVLLTTEPVKEPALSASWILAASSTRTSSIGKLRFNHWPARSYNWTVAIPLADGCSRKRWRTWCLQKRRQ